MDEYKRRISIILNISRSMEVKEDLRIEELFDKRAPRGCDNFIFKRG